MDKRVGHYTQIANLYQLPLGRPPKEIKNKVNWYESKALEKIYILSGIAYLGIAGFLHLEHSELANNLKPIPRTTTPHRKELMDRAIKNRLVAVNTVLPTEKNQIIELVGLIGLGLLKIVCGDCVAPATYRLSIIKILIQNDPTAFLVFQSYPNEFDGMTQLKEEMRVKNYSALNYKAMLSIYQRMSAKKT